jgi:chromosome segregation ATPase
MPTSNGLNKPNVLIAAAIILAGGGGGVGGAMAGGSRAREEAGRVERRVDGLETTQAVIKEKVTNMEDDLDEMRQDNRDAHKAILDAITDLKE